jgi:SAM-dependent methyltransferase
MIHEKGYWLSTNETNTHVYDKLLCDATIFLIQNSIKTIIDIGCGNGAYTINFLQNGFDCVGFDGSPLTPELTNNVCQIKDFSEYVDVGKYDLVFCLEVGEHIPAKYEQIFIDNICRAAKDYIILSWGIVGQGGTGHVNCRNNDYIINEMLKRGFNFNLNDSNYLRKNSNFSYFKNTIMAFNK